MEVPFPLRQLASLPIRIELIKKDEALCKQHPAADLMAKRPTFRVISRGEDQMIIHAKDQKSWVVHA